jgi:predicted Rossmann-fold nucleotide-binding protein
MRLVQVISGGQTGVDQAAWRAAQRAGLETGGSMPLGFLTEEGPRPEFGQRFQARALASEDPDERTRENVARSDATLVLVGFAADRGTNVTLMACQALGKPHHFATIPVEGDESTMVRELLAWLEFELVVVLNVAGPRESSEPGIGTRAEAFLGQVFQALRDD